MSRLDKVIFNSLGNITLTDEQIELLDQDTLGRIEDYNTRFDIRPSKKSLMERQTEATEKIADKVKEFDFGWKLIDGTWTAVDYYTKEEVDEMISKVYKRVNDIRNEVWHDMLGAGSKLRK